jgi:hypothetical protein
MSDDVEYYGVQGFVLIAAAAIPDAPIGAKPISRLLLRRTRSIAQRDRAIAG